MNLLLKTDNQSLSKKISSYFLFCLVIILTLSIFTVFYLGLLHDQIKLTTKITLPFLSNKNEISSQTQKINAIVNAVTINKFSEDQFQEFSQSSAELIQLSNKLLNYTTYFNETDDEKWPLNLQIRKLDQSLHNYLYFSTKFLNQVRLNQPSGSIEDTFIQVDRHYKNYSSNLQETHLLAAKYEVLERKKLENIIEFSIISFFLVLISFILFFIFIWKKTILKLQHSFKIGTNIIRYQIKHQTKAPQDMVAFLPKEVLDFVNVISMTLTKQRLAEERVIKTEKRLASIRHEERLDLSQFIHDHLGQTITAIQLFINSLKKTFPLLEDRQTLLFNQINSCAKDAVDITRAMSQNLRAPKINKQGLRDSIKELISSRNELKLIKFSFYDDYQTEISFKLSIIIFQCIQECVNNTLKHSKAEYATLSIKEKNNNLFIIFSDNGLGFSKKILEDSKNKSLGIKGMKKSVIREKGKFRISSLENKGTRVIILLPLCHTKVHA